MITAKDVSELLNKEDPHFDDFIEKIVIPRFISKGNRDITIDESKIHEFFRDKGFVNSFGYIRQQFTIRGFSVTHESDERPCGSSWLRIIIPPQGE